MSGKLVYTPNENILCFHGALIYEAKVLKAELWDKPEEKGPHYFVHYKGWKNTWDEWVPEERTLKLNDENLKRQKDLEASMKASSAAAAKKKAAEKEKAEASAAESAPAAKQAAGSNNKRKRENTAEKEEEFLKKAEVKIALPDLLKVQLVDDWEWITKEQKLVHLPREIHVERILELYRESRENKKPPVKDLPRATEVLDEVINGIKVYFEKALGNILLYRFERPQYQDIIRTETTKPVTQIYGAEHLLRLFVQFPSLIAHTNMDQDNVNILREYFTDFLKFLAKNKKEFFLSSYDNSSPAYVTSSRA